MQAPYAVGIVAADSGTAGQSKQIGRDPTDGGLIVHVANGASVAPLPVVVSTGKTIQTATGTVSANTAIVALVAARRIKVTAFSLMTAYSAGSLGAIFTDGSGGTTLWALLLQAISGSISGANLAKSEPAWLFGTSAGVALFLNPAGQNITYSVSYFTDDAT